MTHQKVLLTPFKVCLYLSLVFVTGNFNASFATGGMPVQESENETDNPEAEAKFITNARQLTFEGRRAGEGYFNADGTKMVFQSERTPGNPFFQIFVLDFETGDVTPVSPGFGKTTCAWIHPTKNKVLFASTQDDPKAVEKQRAEIEMRESGKERRYSWDYDENYEMYAYDVEGKKYDRLTNAKGYDAEGSYSPDGKLVAFASNREAYSRELSEEEKKAFEKDPSVLMDIYIMNADGSDVRKLTKVLGYDGGPFFSPDGKRICWRRFKPNGAVAEIMTMNIDGSDKKQLTGMNAMSWAPMYHPSGKYIIYNTNVHGFSNFELYLVATDGKSRPVRVSYTNGFDGLASFTPDGNKITWTSGRHDPSRSKKKSQIQFADWNHKAALEALAVKPTVDKETATDFETGTTSAKESNPSFDQRDIMRHVDYLCRKELGGRMTGSLGERKATAYIAAYMKHLGLEPAGDNGSWFQEFEFTNGARLGANNSLSYVIQTSNQKRSIDGSVVDKDWRPLTFTANTKVEGAPVVFAGYGIVAPETETQKAYDSYAGLDVKDSWVLVFRLAPEDVSSERRVHLQFHGNLRKKIFHARENGAKGLIVMSGPNSKVRKQLVPMSNDFSPTGSSVAAISITDAVGERLTSAMGKSLKEIQDAYDNESVTKGFQGLGVNLSAEINVKKIIARGRNVIGRLNAGDKKGDSAVIVGAHVDHLGTGSGGSLAKQEEQGSIHFGADDNASGIAAMLEIAEYIATEKRKGKLTMKRDLIFAGWSGEEMGLKGSAHFVANLQSKMPAPDPTHDIADAHDFTIVIDEKGQLAVGGKPTTLESLGNDLAFIGKSAPDFEIKVVASNEDNWKAAASVLSLCKEKNVKNIKMISMTDYQPKKKRAGGIYPTIAAALNMDMVGRFEKKLVLQGLGSSDYWAGAIESKNALIGLPISPSDDTNLPTDASSFYVAGVPILSAFTGSHTDYHTPRDTPEKLNYPDAARIAKLMGLITRSLATSDEIPKYIKREAKQQQMVKGGLRAYLGTVPNYEEAAGVLLSDVSKGGPADLAGLKGGDLIVELAGKKVENVYDYTAIIDAIKIGQETTVAVMRDGKRLELKITPGSRQ